MPLLFFIRSPKKKRLDISCFDIFKPSQQAANPAHAKGRELIQLWSGRQDLNLRPHAPKACTLPLRHAPTTGVIKSKPRPWQAPRACMSAQNQMQRVYLANNIRIVLSRKEILFSDKSCPVCLKDTCGTCMTFRRFCSNEGRRQ